MSSPPCVLLPGTSGTGSGIQPCRVATVPIGRVSHREDNLEGGQEYFIIINSTSDPLSFNIVSEDCYIETPEPRNSRPSSSARPEDDGDGSAYLNGEELRPDASLGSKDATDIDMDMSVDEPTPPPAPFSDPPIPELVGRHTTDPPRAASQQTLWPWERQSQLDTDELFCE